MQTGHTPVPWWAGKDEDGRLVYGAETDPETGAQNAVVVADTGREDGDDAVEAANAALIVRAVNSHDVLLTACEGLAGLPDRTRKFVDEYPAGTVNAEDAWDEHCRHRDAVYAAARKAIAAARGG